MGLTERAFVCVLCWVLFVELSASCWLAAALADDRASGDGFSAFTPLHTDTEEKAKYLCTCGASFDATYSIRPNVDLI